MASGYARSRRMTRCFAPVVLAACLLGAAVSQDIPGLKVTLQSRPLVSAHKNVELRLFLQATADVEVPSELISGTRLGVKCNDASGQPIVVAGKGGPVTLPAGTQLARTIVLPTASFVPAADAERMARVFVNWEGMGGVGCDFKVAPDTKKLTVGQLDLAKTQVVLVTNYGDMTLSLRPDKAPKHVESFVKLCLDGFYDGTKFHRVVRDYVIQGGCPFTKDDTKPELWGRGGPGYALDAEFNDLRHLRGTLSAARTSDPHSAGSGFFVVHKDALHLDDPNNRYTAFGSLEAGADTLDRIASVPVGGRPGSEQSAPLQPVVLEAAIVLPVVKK
jgi:peptidyl-prolyl cis-trans isomerase B (cyclophilin B)